MEYYLNVSEKGVVSSSVEGPDKQAAMTITIRSSSSARIGELLTIAKDHVKTHDVILEGLTGAFNKMAMPLGYKNVNTVMVSSILEYRRD